MNTAYLKHRADLFVGGLASLAALLVYLRTLCPSLYWGDCGELATAAYDLGIAHPTGYPVWCLLGKLWTLLLPFGSIIWRLNTLSAVFGALAVAAFYGFGRAIGLPRPVALAVAGLFAFSRTFWQQCLFAETYSLTACYTGTLLFLAARWRAQGCRDADLRWLALAYGLAMTNHQTNTLFLPGFVAFLLWSAPELRRWRDPAVCRRWARAAGVLLLPLLSYAYLPLRAHAHPIPNWDDPETPFAFFYHVTGRAYAGGMFHGRLTTIAHRLVVWAVGLGAEFPWPLLGASLLGLWHLWRREGDRPMALLMTWVLVSDVGYTINYSIYNRYIYFIPSYIVLSTLAGVGLLYGWQRAEAATAAWGLARYRALAAACLIGLVPVQAVGHWHKNDLSHDWTCYDFGRNLLASVPRGGILIDNGSDTGAAAISYLQRVEGYRTDVTHVKRSLLMNLYNPEYERWINGWYVDQLTQTGVDLGRLYTRQSVSWRQSLDEDPLRRIMAAAVQSGRPVAVLDISGGPIFMDDSEQPIPLDQYLNQRYDTARVGLLTRLYPHRHRPTAAALLAQTRQVWQSYSLRGVYQGVYLEDDFLTPIALEYADAGLARARLADASGEYADAETCYRDVLRLFKSDEAAEGLRRCARVHAVTDRTVSGMAASGPEKAVTIAGEPGGRNGHN